MTTRHLVDPELLGILDIVPEMQVSPEKLEATRTQIAAGIALGLENPDPEVAVAEHHAPGLDGEPDVRVRLYRPEGLSANAPVLLHIHGGGYLFGTDALGDPRNRAWAKAIGCAIVSVNYRLAPQTRFPGALEDCYAVLVWLHREGPALGLDPSRIALRGDSAGGGLAAGLALLSRDRGGPPILFQLLIYPMLDDRTSSSDEPNPFSGEFVWSRESNAYGWAGLLGTTVGTTDVSHLAAPVRAKDLAGLPPAMIATAALDLFVDENLDYAKRLIRSGVPTEVYVAPGAFHGFEAMVPDATVSKRFTALCQDAVRRAFSL